ncbi:MAG: hypothetical protein J6U18_04155 [Acetobacter sp.]|nr:hypothetical protein [Acetobacter sp.]
MSQNEYEEILKAVEAMRKEVYKWNDRLMAEGKTQTRLQDLPPWTMENYPYKMVDSEKTISMLMRFFNDCYLKKVCWILREGQLTTHVPSWVTAPRDIIEAINNTGQLMREIMYANEQLRIVMIDMPSLPQSASIALIQKTLAGFHYNVKMQSRIIANKNQPQ